MKEITKMGALLMLKVIIYYRKSTDRDDKQANSLEHQLENCRKVATSNNFEILKEIWESKSAKTEWTRDWFNELIRLCKTWKIDYIIIDEPKRLSRNNIDTSRVIDLMDKQKIKWILWTSREYKSDNSRDKFLLQLDLSLSKMDNEDRAKDTKDKMLSCMTKTGRFLWLAPFWYKNITIAKGHKEISIDKKEGKVVKEIYALRLENKAYTTIAETLKKKYKNKGLKLQFNANRIQKLVRNKFYYGVFTWTWKEYIWTHKPLITKETYDKSNNIWKWVHEKIETLAQSNKEREPRKYYLKWLAKDISWISLSAYVKKWIVYYSNQGRSSEKVSINQNLIFQKAWEIIKKFDWENEVIKSINKDMILDLIKQEKSDKWSEFVDIDSQIKKLKSKQEKLLDLRLEDNINNEIYLFKNNSIENEIKEFLEQKEHMKKDDFEEKTLMMLELAGSFYRSYFKSNEEWKTYIIKNLMFELSVSTKKELQIAESDLFESSKMLTLYNGVPNGFDIRTFKYHLSKIDLEEMKEFHKFIREWFE